MSTTNAATPAKRFALIGEIDGQAVASGFWRNEATAGDALVAATALAEDAGVGAEFRLIAVDNAVLGNHTATARELLTQLAPTPMKAHTRKAAAKAKKAAAAKATGKSQPATAGQARQGGRR